MNTISQCTMDEHFSTSKMVHLCKRTTNIATTTVLPVVICQHIAVEMDRPFMVSSGQPTYPEACLISKHEMWLLIQYIYVLMPYVLLYIWEYVCVPRMPQMLIQMVKCPWLWHIREILYTQFKLCVSQIVKQNLSNICCFLFFSRHIRNRQR